MKPWQQNLNRIRQQAVESSPGKLGKTLLEILGKERLVIERHKGIHRYGTEQILVRSSFGYICITGAQLKLCCMTKEQLCITGKIDKIELIGGSADGSVE